MGRNATQQTEELVAGLKRELNSATERCTTTTEEREKLMEEQQAEAGSLSSLDQRDTVLHSRADLLNQHLGNARDEVQKLRDVRAGLVQQLEVERQKQMTLK